MGPRGEVFLWRTLEAHDLSHPWMGPLVTRRPWAIDDEPAQLTASCARSGGERLRLWDEREGGGRVPPFPSAPMTVAEYRRRMKVAGWSPYKESRDPARPNGFASRTYQRG